MTVRQPEASSWIGSGIVERLLATLDPEQRAAATLPDGPALVIAPAGSGKTTILVARLAVLLARGVAPERIAVATFNRAAAVELADRIASRLAPDIPGASRIEVRTLHALARQVVIDARGEQELVADRLPLLRLLLRRHAAAADGQGLDLPDAPTLDTEVSAWKVEARPPAHPALVDEYRAMLTARRAMDFDDLVADAVRLLGREDAMRRRWQARFSHLCIDEFQDVDAGQLRLCRLLAAPRDNLFVVGDDDQTIYAWRLADVRRILGFQDLYPAARRVQLATNYRCPPEVVWASSELIRHNAERFEKEIRVGAPGASEDAPSRIAAFDSSAEDWPDRLAVLAATEVAERRAICFLARTRAELTPLMAALVRADVAHRSSVEAPARMPQVVALLATARRQAGHLLPFDVLRGLRAAHRWRRADGAEALGEDEHAALDALMGWSVGFCRLDRFLAASDDALARLEALRRPDALVELVTVHAAKGREWPTVVVVGMEEDRFPNRRALVDAREPARALEDERRLAYVAMTRATRRLVLAFDRQRPSRFLVESGLLPGRAATARPAAQPV